MGNKKQANQFLDFLTQSFPADKDYVICTDDLEKLNSFFIDMIYHRTVATHKKEIWGTKSRMITAYGQSIGWVPDRFDVIFFADSAIGEIAESLVNRQNRLKVCDQHVVEAISFMESLKIGHLRNVNPLFLSEGETKLLWFLSQYVKSPKFLIIPKLTAGLSKMRAINLIEFILHTQRLRHDLKKDSPVYIIGLSTSEHDYADYFKQSDRWQLVQDINFIYNYRDIDE